jgi:hypothetical protein
MFLISIMGTKSIEGEMSDGGGGGVSDTQGSSDGGGGSMSNTQWSRDGGGGTVSDTQGSGMSNTQWSGGTVSDTQGSSDGWGGICGVSQSYSVVADAGVVLADAREGRVNGFRVVRHS